MNTLTIVGFGDIARRALPLLTPHFTTIRAMVRPARQQDFEYRSQATPFAADLDRPETLSTADLQASHLVHLAPPPASGAADTRTRNLLAALAATSPLPERLVYISTSGVYGDCGGAWISESRPVNPQSDRARRRVDAEQAITAFGSAHGVRTVILRVPGIYAADRLPIERIRKGTPVLQPQDDVYTNHIHADDLAAIVATALTHPAAAGIYNASDDSDLAMGAWFDLIADRAGLPRPPRIERAHADAQIPPALLSFMRESRRLDNTRMKRELGVRLRYPTVSDGVPARISAK